MMSSATAVNDELMDSAVSAVTTTPTSNGPSNENTTSASAPTTTTSTSISSTNTMLGNPLEPQIDSIETVVVHPTVKVPVVSTNEENDPNKKVMVLSSSVSPLPNDTTTTTTTASPRPVVVKEEDLTTIDPMTNTANTMDESSSSQLLPPSAAAAAVEAVLPPTTTHNAPVSESTSPPLPPATWHMLQPLVVVSSSISSTTTSAALKVVYIHQPIRIPTNALTTTTIDTPKHPSPAVVPIRYVADRTLRRPTLLRYSIHVPNHQTPLPPVSNHNKAVSSSAASCWYLDVVDDTEEQDSMMKGGKKRGNSANHHSSGGSGSNSSSRATTTSQTNQHPPIVVVPTTSSTATKGISPPPTIRMEAIPNPVAISRGTARYVPQLEATIQQQQFLYDMTWSAILEECQRTWYQNTNSTTTTTINSTTTATATKSLGTETNVTNTNTTLTRIPFSYYTETPSTVSTSTNVATTISNSYDQLHRTDLTLVSSVSFTPANVMQRIKQACQLLQQELHNDTQYQHAQQMIASLTSHPTANDATTISSLNLPRRSSTRIVMNQTANVTTTAATTNTTALNGGRYEMDATSKDGVVSGNADHTAAMMLRTKHGGRIALALLQPPVPSTPNTASSTAANSRRSTAPIQTEDDVKEEMVDDELEDEEYEIEPKPTEEDDDEDEEEEGDLEAPNDEVDDNDEEELMGTKNPYLVPDRFALLEWIGKKAARTWSTTDLQSIFANQMVYYDMTQRKKKGKKSQIPSRDEIGRNVLDALTSDTDLYIISQLLYEQSQDNPHSTFHTLPFMMSSTLSKHEKIMALMNLLFPNNSDEDAGNNNGPTKLVVILSGGNIEEIDETIDEWDLSYFCRTQFTLRLLVNDAIQNEILYHVEQQAVQQQEAYKEQRHYETYRYRSIQSGFCHWGVSWLQVANDYVTARSTNVVHNAAASVVPSEEQDLILAQTLAAQLDADPVVGESGRRKTRRVGESSGVFYGNQSNLSQKQIMDALLRLISSPKQPYQTLVGLLHALPDDSTDPMKRMRTVIGKLLFKRNQVSRMEVQTLATDSEIWNMLHHKKTQISRVDVSTNCNDETPSLVVSGEENTTNESELQLAELMDYVCSLQQTELQLRRLVVQHLSEVPIPIVASAGDDRVGSMESMDDVDFEDPNLPISWQTEGSPYLSQRIFRPIAKDQDVGESTKCYWFTITGFVPSVVLPPPTTIEPFEKPSIGRAREPMAVERRTRFRAVPSDATTQHSNVPPLILTEAQIRAGLKAAELHLSKQQSTSNLSDHPLPSMSMPKVCLVPIQSSEDMNTSETNIEGFVVGHDRHVNADNGVIENTMLVLPKIGSTCSSAFWTSLMMPTPENGLGGIICSVNNVQYTVQQFDFHQSSKAFNACMGVVRFLERHPKCSPFLQPVDPIALGIPDYFNVVKYPMDVSTLLKKLEQGDYAHIPPNFMKGQDSVVRMLNGTFRKDVERIFDNALLFNPPDDWIHQAASVIKKAVVKKIEQASTTSDVYSLGRQRKKNSLYVDYDSDVDMYVYESDNDDTNYSRNRKKRSTISNANKQSNGGKHNRGPISEDAPTRAVERGIRIQKMLSDTFGVRGPLSDLPIQSDPSDFSLPSEWTCQYKTHVTPTKIMTSEENGRHDTMSSLTTALDELRSLHRLTEENDQIGVRRSTRAVLEQQQEQNALASSSPAFDLEYVCPHTKALGGAISSSSNDVDELPRNRLQVELLRERLHESYFAKLYQSDGKKLMEQQNLNENMAVNDEAMSSFLAEYADGSFPPYLGRVVPMIPLSKESTLEVKPHIQWEIREPYIVPALRWVIRGLLNTEHLVQISDSGSVGNPLRESILSQNENVLLFPNHIYYIDESSDPFDILDVKELARRKKQKNTKSNDDDDSDDDIEMSEYEKARAERMARNKDRLVALGLA